MKAELIFDNASLAIGEAPRLAPSIDRGTIVRINEGGDIAAISNGEYLVCEWLQAACAENARIDVGDTVLVWKGREPGLGVVLGRIGAYRPPCVVENVTIEATESLTLKCGEASVDLRADGKVMVRGEDVLLRATGTQRIRAGKVAIN